METQRSAPALVPSDGDNSLKESIAKTYGQAARRVREGQAAGCGGGSAATACCGGPSKDPISSNLYDRSQVAGIPDDALAASLGCGNPTALAELRPGEVVLDLGSGGGIDVLLSAKRVGAAGKAYGLDMTDDMLELARENQRKSGLQNAEFLKGEIENIPLPDNSVDVIISNCVINLSTDKSRVLAEAFRVLRPGGRFAVADIVVRGDVPAEIRRNVELWVGCVAGALEETTYRNMLAAAGFTRIEIEPVRVYSESDARALVASEEPGSEDWIAAAAGKFISAFVRAEKPREV